MLTLIMSNTPMERSGADDVFSILFGGVKGETKHSSTAIKLRDDPFHIPLFIIDQSRITQRVAYRIILIIPNDIIY